MSDRIIRDEMPIGFSMTLAKDLEAMNYFTSQSSEIQQQMIAKASSIETKQDMEAYVNSLSKEHFY